MRQRKILRLAALPVGAVALLLSCSAGGLSGETGPIDPKIASAAAGLDPTTSAHASRVDMTRPASIDAASPDPTGLSPSVEFSAGEATPFECALDGVAFAECTSPRAGAGASDGLDTFGVQSPTLAEDDPTLAIGDVTTTEGNTGTVDAGFTVTLSAASATTVTVDYATAGVSATSGIDFESSTGTLTFAPGDTSEPVVVQVNGDVLDENDETFTVTLSTAVGATIGDDSGVGTIVDDDPTLSVSDVTVTEGNGGTAAAAFTVTLSAAASFPVSVDYATANVTATAGSDYTAVSATLNFAVGETSKTVTVTVQGDNVHEANETFTLELTNPSNGTFGDSTGVGTITNDDTAPKFAVNDVVVSEGGGSAVLTVSRNRDSQLSVTVDAATANDSATAGSDYTAVPTTTLTFVPGDLSETVTVPVTADAVDEPNETFFVNLSNPAIATIGDAQGIATIVDDDSSPSLSIDDQTLAEGAGATFTVTLSGTTVQTVAVNYASVAGTATSPADFGGVSGVLSFAPGETTKTIPVSSADDALDEDSENYTIALSGATNATIADELGLGMITDDDAEPSVSIDDAAVAEGGTATFTVTLAPVSGRLVTVGFATANGSATAGSDYSATSGTLSFEAGETSKQMTVPVTGDALDETVETFAFNLSGAVNATLADGDGIATITDDDPAPALSIDDTVAVESGVNATFTVKLDAPSGYEVSVAYATAHGSATAADYAATSGGLTFAQGETSKQFTVPITSDVLDEENETFAVNLSGAVNATIADGEATGVITDDDALPGLSVNDVSVIEGNAGTVSANFTVSLSAPSGRTVTANFATGGGTAASGSDYLARSGTVTFAPGETSQQLSVTVNGDALAEASETYFLNLSGATNANIADSQGVGTIIDDDGDPVLFVDDVTVTEGQSGTVDANFTVNLSAASGQTVSVGYATADGTATAGADYTFKGGNLVFTPGVMSRPLTVQVKSDISDEIDESFLVNLTDNVNAEIADSEGVGTILDDDLPPSLSVNDVAVAEGNAGTVAAAFAITLNAPSGKSVSVHYATSDAAATAPADYATGTGTLSFAAGETTKTVVVTVNGDVLNEVNEGFTLNLANAINATISDPNGAGTITDDDPQPTLSIDDVTLVEGDTGSAYAVFTAVLSGASGRTVSVNYATGNGTAVAPADYAATSGSLSFAPGETTKTVTVTVNGDALDEENETFTVGLSGAAGATVTDPSGLGTITDDDARPALSVNDITVTEGNAGTVAANFSISLSAPSGRSVTVMYATANGSALAPGDYEASSATTLSFAAGETTRQVSVLVNGDTLDEVTETYSVNLSNETNATIADGQGGGTIIDDDTPPTLAINDLSVIEGQSGTVNANMTVTLSAASGKTVSVGYTTADGTATAGADYTAGGGNIVFEPGVTSQPLTIPVKSDILNELDETFFANLAEENNATIADGQGEVTITDDDGPATVSINDVTVAEGSSGTVEAAFTVSLKAPSGQNVTLDYVTADVTATAPTDYRAATGTLTFEPGETAERVTVTVESDVLDELNETYVVNLSNPSNATIADAQGVGTISDDDDDAPPPPPAPPAPPPPLPLASDTTPPGEITNVRVVNGDGIVTVIWRNPSDADFQRVSAVRIKAGAAAQNLSRYEGRGTTFTDRGLQNGLPYRYRVRTYDGAGNVSAGVTVAALPKAALFGPPKGATITAPPTLRWKAIRGATYYNVQLYRIGRGGQAHAVTATKVLSAWPNGTSYKLRRTWRFDGKTYRLAAGAYRWYVWPGLAKRSAKRYGPMVGESSFTVKATKATKTRR